MPIQVEPEGRAHSKTEDQAAACLICFSESIADMRVGEQVSRLRGVVFQLFAQLAQ